MNKQITLISIPLLFCILVGCTETKEHKLSVSESPLLVTHILDLSESTNGINYFDSSDAWHLYRTIAENGGGALRYLTATDHSTAQNILSLDIPDYDTTPTQQEKNIYRRAKLQAKNRQYMMLRHAQAERDITPYISAVSQPHNTHFTDLSMALTLSAQTLAQETHKDYRRYLLISSDMLNDPSWKRHADLEPVQLHNVTVLVIRPALSEDKLKDIFPGTPVHIFTNTRDAI